MDHPPPPPGSIDMLQLCPSLQGRHNLHIFPFLFTRFRTEKREAEVPLGKLRVGMRHSQSEGNPLITKFLPRPSVPLPPSLR